MPVIRLLKLECIVNDEIDEDEVFLKYKGKKIWPQGRFYKSINTSESFELDLPVHLDNPHEPIKIELWDFDYLSANDFLGYFEMTIGDEKMGEFSTSMTLQEKDSTASYVLHWEIE